MLHGIRPELHRTLLDLGVRLYGYFVRRLAERPANLRFLLTHPSDGPAG